MEEPKKPKHIHPVAYAGIQFQDSNVVGFQTWSAKRSIMQRLTVSQISREVFNLLLSEYGIHEKHIRSRSRKFEFVRCRSLWFYLMRRYTNCSLSEIGKMLGRDHSTVVHSIKKIDDEKQMYAECRERYIELEMKLQDIFADIK